MAGANSNIQLTSLDFDEIKQGLKTYLKSQNTFKDYNFDGSGLSVLMDVLAYNTQYNAYYLNMVGNEMFLDTATQRSSVISQAKVLNYVPKSAIAPTATVTVTINNVNDSSLTLPAYTHFLSESVNGVNYKFVTTDSKTVNVSSNTAIFNDIQIKQGTPVSYSYTYNSLNNPDSLFELPDDTIDTTTLVVTIQQSSSNTYTERFDLASNYMQLDSTSAVYFLQESLNNTYEIYFGNGIIGKKLVDGNIVRVTYLSTEGSASSDANSFVLMDSISGYSSSVVTPMIKASTGGNKETIQEIKYNAPKSYAAQNRAVSKEDYITAIQQNKLGYSFDAVNVWGGQENQPPVYGQVFVCVKPQGAYTLTENQKTKLVQDVLKPISVMTVEPIIVDPDYTYLQITANVYYDPKKTTLTSGQIQSSVKNALTNLASIELNTFNSTFNYSNFVSTINSVDPSIITNEISLKVQKKIYPNLSTPTTYKLYYGVPLEKGMFQSGITSSPSVQFRNPLNASLTINGVYVEEVPSSTGGLESISIINPGYSYQQNPTVAILGDGIGATAIAQINSNGTLKSITVTNKGSGYTSAIVQITPAPNDTTGQQAAAIAILEGRYGTLRSYYNNTQNVKTVLNNNIGTVDYQQGIVTLNAFGPLDVDNPLGLLTVTANPTTNIISSSYNRVITVDPFDPNAIIVNVIAKT